MMTKKFTVSGPLRVLGVKPGDTVELDSDDQQTARLLARGQIVPVSSRRQSGGAPTEDAPASESEE